VNTPDIIDRLRSVHGLRTTLCAEAADEIASLRAQLEAAQADAERYRWLRDNPRWSVAYRIKPRTNSTEWRMRDEGEWWGEWWPTHEQAVDHAAAIHKARGVK
jgi:hypothetical protein